MEEAKKNEELQSRREFFKKAAKRVLPVIGLLALSSVPSLVSASNAMGCKTDGCTGTCEGTCKGTCRGDCKGGCRDTCTNTCEGGCKGTCRKITKH